MKVQSPKSTAYGIAVLTGCGLFLAFFLSVAHRIYSSFKETGVPVWSSGKIVATLDPLIVTLSFSAFAVLAASLVAWRTVRLMRQRSKSYASEL